jgi:tRNA 5-methylaminomethyl-2-thiouridine biosynthesis bifunctional protein
VSLPASAVSARLQALRERWPGRESIVVLHGGRFLDAAFAAAWQAWRDDAARCHRLVFIAVDAALPDAPALRAGLKAPLVLNELLEQWPPSTND